MSLFKPLCIFAFVQFLSFTNGQSLDATCTNAQERCVSVYSCPPIVAALNVGRVRQNVIEELRKLRCGYDGSIPLVCCSDDLSFNPTTTTTPRPVTTSTTRRPTRVTSPAGEDENLLPTAGNCGDSTTFRIFGGNVTDITEFPWMVILQYSNASGFLSFECGGVLINDRYVLTAAHCVIANRKLELARLGEYNLLTSPDCIGERTSSRQCAPMHQDISIEETTVHPGYSSSDNSRKDDIALLRLSEPANLGVFVNPICLPSSSETRVLSDDDLYVAGWGKILNGTKSNIKLKLIVPLFDKPRCDSLFRSANAILTERQICAGGEFAKDACSGDSGGPLMQQQADASWVAVGVVSFGAGCGRDGWPGVYTDVRSYMDWIRQTIRK